MKKETKIYKGKWYTFYWGWNFDLSYELCGYFDPRHRLNLDLILFSLEIILPFKSKYTDECDPPKWGVSYHNQTLWIYRGGKGNFNGGNKWWTMYMPWQYSWVRTSALKKDGTWEHETKCNRKNFYEDKWDEILWTETYPFVYVLKNGTHQYRTAKLKVQEREWRWHWFKWLPYPRQISRTIDINFNDEVGERTGTWKGGTTGCSYELKKGETPLECLHRMEIEREFN